MSEIHKIGLRRKVFFVSGSLRLIPANVLLRFLLPRSEFDIPLGSKRVSCVLLGALPTGFSKGPFIQVAFLSPIGAPPSVGGCASYDSLHCATMVAKRKESPLCRA